MFFQQPTPTAPLDRTNDHAYECTTAVVRAVMALSQSARGGGGSSSSSNSGPDALENVRRVGLELRSLLAAVDALMPAFPPTTHRQVEMAHKVLSVDMHELISAMRATQRYVGTTVEEEYKKWAYGLIVHK